MIRLPSFARKALKDNAKIVSKQYLDFLLTDINPSQQYTNYNDKGKKREKEIYISECLD
jgi:peptide methionine sulfoxide reductase MsrA